MKMLNRSNAEGKIPLEKLTGIKSRRIGIAARDAKRRFETGPARATSMGAA
jgi:hypothetical protein